MAQPAHKTACGASRPFCAFGHGLFQFHSRPLTRVLNCETRKPVATLLPFDWQRIFLGDESPLFLLEIVFRTVWMFAWLLLLARLLGKRALNDLTPFDYILVIALGSAVGDPMMVPNVPLTHGMLVMTVIVLLEIALARITRTSKAVEKVVDSTPTLLVKNGKILDLEMDVESISNRELLMLLRLEGIRSVGEVERAYLEPSGQLSIFRYDQGAEVEGVSTMPEDHNIPTRANGEPDSVHMR